MKFTVAQLDPVVGDVRGNVARAVEALGHAAAAGSELLVLSELFLSGYPPRDLVEKPWFLDRVARGVEELAEASARHPETGILVGAPLRTGLSTGRGLANAAVLLYRGRVVFRQEKSLLPFYDIFDEARHFDPAPHVGVFAFRGETLGITICEDAWNDPAMWRGGSPYAHDPVQALANMGATLLVNLSASPFHLGKEELRFRLIGRHAIRHGLPFIYVNQVGGYDELIFDGGSLVVDRHGEPVATLPSCEEALATFDTAEAGAPERYIPEGRVASARRALALGVRDYMAKCGFKKALVGLSGGIDSAVVAAIAADAVGGENVIGVTMPSPYSSRGSVEDSRELAANLGLDFRTLPIDDVFGALKGTLAESFRGRPEDVTEENLQARIRGTLLMALSNKFGALLLSTGNKSEIAVGYCTLYGDMCGGLSVIADLPKTFVYELAAEFNRDRERIPQATIDKPPSAELAPGQVDQDTLPPYPVLDAILALYVEESRSVAAIVAEGYDEATVRWVVRAVDRSEYKRRQAAPGLKITSKAFGSGRRMPIAARWEN